MQKATIGNKNQTIIETDRLILREFQLEDAQNFFELNNDKLVMKYTGDKPFNSVNESRQLIENYDAYPQTGMGRWTVVEKSSGLILGWCGLKKHADGMIDLGYRFHQKYWNQGFATEASAACLEYGHHQLGIKRIIGRTAQENKASIRVLEKIGMVYWKKAPCEGIENSVFYVSEIQEY
jgi:RimJ/RimL family protein N-acetyltransferase